MCHAVDCTRRNNILRRKWRFFHVTISFNIWRSFCAAQKQISVIWISFDWSNMLFCSACTNTCYIVGAGVKTDCIISQQIDNETMPFRKILCFNNFPDELIGIGRIQHGKPSGVLPPADRNSSKKSVWNLKGTQKNSHRQSRLYTLGSSTRIKLCVCVSVQACAGVHA